MTVFSCLVDLPFFEVMNMKLGIIKPLGVSSMVEND